MVDRLVAFSAWLTFGVGALSVLVSPSLVGIQPKPYTPWVTVRAVVALVLGLPMIGRALGWW